MSNIKFINKILDLYSSDPKLSSIKVPVLQDFFKDFDLPVKIADVTASLYYGVLFTLESKHDDNVQQVECDDFDIHHSHSHYWCLDLEPDSLTEEQFIEKYRTYIIEKLKQLDKSQKLASEYTYGLNKHLDEQFNIYNKQIQNQISTLNEKVNALSIQTSLAKMRYNEVLTGQTQKPIRKPRS